MLICGILFYVFAAMLIISALMVVSAKNSIYSVLWLILCFFDAAGLFMLLGAEFISMMLIIVYVGAVMVLFIFVVMTINIEESQNIKTSFSKYKFVCALISLCLCVDLYIAFSSTLSLPNLIIADPTIFIPNANEVTNTQAIGMVLYTDYLLPFIIAGFILFIAMMGAIIIISRNKVTSKKQNICKQIKRTREESVKLVKVDFYKGIK